MERRKGGGKRGLGEGRGREKRLRGEGIGEGREGEQGGKPGWGKGRGQRGYEGREIGGRLDDASRKGG